MEVKPGYKQTEVGVIPEEWDAGFIGQAVERLEAGASVNSDKDGILDFDNYPCVLKTGAAKDGALNLREIKKVAQRDLWRLKVNLRKDTILVSRMNTVELVGESGYVDADYPNVFVPDRMWMATLRSTIHPRWFSCVLTWQLVKSRISSSATGTSGSMKNISKPSLRAVRIPYPPVDEQRAIAEALSDVDALLGGLGRLIAKKRDLKQAAMQQLLTGETRLPGFYGQWETKRLGELFEITSSKRVFQSEWRSEGIPFYRARELGVLGETGRVDNELFITRELYETHRRGYGVPSVGDMLVTGVGTLGKVYVASDEREFYFKDGNIIWFKIGGRMSAEFLRQLYLTETILKQVAEGGAGTTVGTYTISAAKKTTIPFPTLAEQTAIAEVLTEMDAELAALEQRREKIRCIKQGMMQQLLTGRIRLVKPEQAEANA